jgi:hypothetical protein
VVATFDQPFGLQTIHRGGDRTAGQVKQVADGIYRGRSFVEDDLENGEIGKA